MANSGDATYEELWKRVLLYYPECPPVFAQEFVNTAYSRAINHYQWSSLRGDGEFVIATPYATGTVSVTQGSTAVTGTATVWTSAMAGREIYIGGQAPYFTIESLDPIGQTMVLDRVYGGVTNPTAAYSIETVYLVCPTDFNGFISVRDMTNNWRLNLNFRQEYIDRWDPKRTNNGSPRILVSAPQNSAGRRRYELWPRGAAGQIFPYQYLRKPSLLSANSDRPIFPIRGDVIREGALVELTLWPGLASNPNPFYDDSLGGYRAREARFKELLAQLTTEDQLVNQTDISYEDYTSIPYAPLDANWIQKHDAIF